MSRKSILFLLTLITIVGIQSFRKPKASGQQIEPLSINPPNAIAQGADSDSGLAIGTILPYFGDPAQLDSSEWEICDGRTVAEPDPQLVDHDPEQAGIQTPNLQGSFLRGADEEHSPGTKGGTDKIEEEALTSRWAKYDAGFWTGFDSAGEDVHIIGWNDGFGNARSGHYSLARAGRGPIDYFTEPTTHDHGGENRPRFVTVQYLIKVR